MNMVQIGKIDKCENEEMLEIYNKKVALEELLKTMPKESSSKVYKQVRCDLKKVLVEYEAWWNKIQEKYNWTTCDNEYLVLDFDTCIVQKKEIKNYNDNNII